MKNHTIGTRVTDTYDEETGRMPGERVGTVTGGQDGRVAVQWDSGAWSTHRPADLTTATEATQ